MEGHAHFRYGTSSVLARPIIHGGRTLIAYFMHDVSASSKMLWELKMGPQNPKFMVLHAN